jgi:hypothetical protein
MKLEDQVERLRQSATEELNLVTPEEYNAWRQHPCTVYLKRTLEADKLDFFINWSNSGYAGPTADITAQENAKAQGSVEAIGLVFDAFDVMSTVINNSKEEEEVDDNPYGT